MSPTRLTARSTARRSRPAGAVALAFGGLLLTGACGTVHAGAEAGPAEPAVAPSSQLPATSATSATSAATAVPAPAVVVGAGRVRTPLILPLTAVTTGGAITGTVSSGLLGCLVVRTDAGQVFNVVGGPTARLRQLLPAEPLTTSSTGGLETRGVGGGVSGSAGAPGSLRISAAGTLRAAPGFCGASYTFTIVTIRVGSLSLR